jgi:acyl-CoA thioester hydrolase
MSPARARHALPDADQVVALPAVRTATAPPAWEDQNGHVNVLAYYEFHMLASESAMQALGVDSDYRRRHGESVFSVEHHVSFFDEVLVGHDVSAHFLALDRTEKLMHAVSILVNRTTGKIANAVEFVEAHVDLATRRACPFQPGLAARMDALLDEHRRLGWEFPLSGSMGLRLSEPAHERR